MKSKMDALRVQIVDDEPDQLRVLGMVVELLGQEVRSSLRGEECADIAAGFRPHLVLLDITMGCKTGFEVARELRRLAFPLIIAAVTGYTGEDWREKCLSTGFDYFLPKPASSAALKALFDATARRLCALGRPAGV